MTISFVLNGSVPFSGSRFRCIYRTPKCPVLGITYETYLNTNVGRLMFGAYSSNIGQTMGPTLEDKNVLNETLCNVHFFTHNPETVQEVTRVWLLLFDLYHRRFSKHDHTEDEVRESLYAQAGILGIDELLWKHRVKLAAEISRIRIKNNALNLSELLPPHLRDEKVAAAINNTECVTGWVNTFRSKKKSDLTESLLKLGMVESRDGIELKTNQYSFDDFCPKFMTCRPEIRQAVAQSWLVRKHHLILQDRSFCLGPVMFCRILEDNELTGYVLQTHVNSPRTTAYLANILAENGKIFQLIAFGAGPRKSEYDKYFDNLGITNTTIFAEKLVDISPESEILEHVVAVYATPPNSYSGVVDPIDLVCSRGGDLSILEVLTESEINNVGRQRVAEILNEQKRTLRFSMSRPQIQFVLYETHSILKAENIEMVKRILEEMNTASKEKHAERQGVWNDTAIPLDKLLSDSESIPDDSSTEGKKELSASKSQREFENLLASIEVPPCDVFELHDLPSLSKNENSDHIFKNYGCFLALLQRKELTRLDHKYMIKMAEARGLFGDDQASKKQTSSRQKKREDRKVQENESKKLKKNKKPNKINAERIAAPTHCTQMRHLLLSSAVTYEAISTLWNTHACKRFRHHQHYLNDANRSLKWWRKTVKHIMSMRLVLSWTNNNLNVSPDQILEAGKGLKPLKFYRRFKKPNKTVLNIPLNVVKYNGPNANFDQIIIDGIKMSIKEECDILN